MKVPYAVTNIKKYMCSQFPVQPDSVCTSDKIGNLKTKMKNWGTSKAIEPYTDPGAYCSSVTAICSDLDPNGDCICKTCSVRQGHCLENANSMMHFCNNDWVLDSLILGDDRFFLYHKQIHNFFSLENPIFFAFSAFY